MTPQEHNKCVGLAQLAYAGLHLLMTIVFLGVEGYMFGNVYSRTGQIGGPAPPPFVVLMFAFIGILSIAMTIPSVVAGYALLRRRPWAKVAGTVAGVVAAMSFPIGSAVAVYTLWFLFGDAGRQLYGARDGKAPALTSNEWQPVTSNSAHAGSPSSTTPPDWR
jgi:hypothetical protein